MSDTLRFQNQMQHCVADLSSWVQSGHPVLELPSALQVQMMSLLEAIGLIVVGPGNTLSVGQTPPSNVLIGLQTWIESRLKGERIFATHELSEEYPSLIGLADTAAGILSIPFSDDGQHYAIWFRSAASTSTSAEEARPVPPHKASAATPKKIGLLASHTEIRCRPSKEWSPDCICAAHILATLLRSHLAFQNLRQNQAAIRLHEAIYDCSSESMVVTDASNFILKANPAFTALTGYHSDDLYGKRPSILKSGRHGANFYKAMWRTINTTGKWKGEIWNRHKSGELRAHTLSIRTLYNDDGTVWRRIGLITDTTERKQAITSLLESELDSAKFS